MSSISGLPILRGQLVADVEVDGASFATIRHGLKRRYVGGFSVAQDTAGTPVIVIHPETTAGLGYDPEQVVLVYNSFGVDAVATLWVF